MALSTTGQKASDQKTFGQKTFDWKTSKKIGLALGSGSARGWAHIGVIQALSEAGINIDYIAGTSIGALVGAVFASGKIDALAEVVLQFDWKKIINFFDVVLPKSGLIDGKKISDFVRSLVDGVNIEELSIPFCAVSTDIGTGREVAINSGDIIEAVRASISVPGIFTPFKKNNTVLVDGGLVNPVPVSAVRNMGADFVIAVDLNHDIVKKRGSGDKTFFPDPYISKTEKKETQETEKKNKISEILNKRLVSVDFSGMSYMKQWTSRESLPNIFDVLIVSINIMEKQITAAKLKDNPPDILIQPNLGHLKFLEFNRADEAIIEGYSETKNIINAIF